MMRSRFTQLLGVCYLGAGIGFICGLSAASVAQSLLSVLLGIAGTTIGIMVGISESTPGQARSGEAGQPDPAPADAQGRGNGEGLTDVPGKIQVARLSKLEFMPFGLFLFGLLLGLPTGILARTNDWFGARPKWVASRWETTGLSEKEISLRLFNEVHPASGQASLAERGVFLAGGTPEDCAAIGGAKGEELRKAMAGRHGLFADIEQAIPKDDGLELVVEKLLCPGH
jgi:hypothetical protein